MKKGSYYIPLFILLVFNMVVNVYIGDWVSLLGWSVSLLLLCEVYYLRFLK